MDKQIALSLANNDVVSSVAKAKQAGKLPESEVAQFEQMCNDVLAKGATLSDEFFAKLESSATGRDIFRAIHAA